MKRKIIHIDESRCNGCGLCIPNCPEGAIRIIDNKARLVSDLFCDGLGACLGHCPEGAISVEEREAEPFDETKVMENIVPKGANTIKAHLEHLLDHGEEEFFRQAVAVLSRKGIPVPQLAEKDINQKNRTEGSNTTRQSSHHHRGCPGSAVRSFGKQEVPETTDDEKFQVESALQQWPIQMHLISPGAAYFKKADLLLAADCTAYALGDFHSKHLKGKALGIACPKLDQALDNYAPKITALIDEAGINSITVLVMEVPCCHGLLSIVKEAMTRAKRKIPLKVLVAGIEGGIISEEWVNIG